MMTCCNDHSERLDPFQCEGTMTLDTENSQQKFVCDTCHARCGIQAHTEPGHAKHVKPEYELYNFSDVADALHAVRSQHHTGKPLTWTGPDEIHYSITACLPEPSWHFSPDGIEYNDERGRGFWDAFIQVAFMFGWHNGVIKYEQSAAMAKKSDIRWIDTALEALENGDLTQVKSLLEMLRKLR